MSYVPDQLNNTGLFIPTTSVFDVSRLYEVDVQSPEFKDLLVILYQNVNNIALALNNKDSGLYVLTEFLNGQTYFPDPALSPDTSKVASPRQVFRKVIDFGQLPNTASKTVAHGINTDVNTMFTRIYGVAANTTLRNYFPLPYVSETGMTAQDISLVVVGPNVRVTTFADRTALDKCYIVLEWIKE